MASTSFNDRYIKKEISSYFSSPESESSNTLSPATVEFEVAKSHDSGISPDGNITFIEDVQILAETLISCTVGIFETQQKGNHHASIALIQMLSKLFLTGHSACENKLKFNWTNEWTKEIERKIKVYNELSDSILYDQQQQQLTEEFSVKLEDNVKKLMKPSIFDTMKEPEIIVISDDEEPPEKKRKMPVFVDRQRPNVFKSVTESCQNLKKLMKPRIYDSKKEPEIILISDDEELKEKKPKMLTSFYRQSQNLLNSVTEGCQDDEVAVIPNSSPVIKFVPKRSLTYTCVKVGYSSINKRPILIVYDQKRPGIVYSYRWERQGRFRCTHCDSLQVRRYAQLYNGVLYAHVHACGGNYREIVECEQRIRAEFFQHAPLPSLLELSLTRDPRPYPPYPRNRPKNPNRFEYMASNPKS